MKSSHPAPVPSGTSEPVRAKGPRLYRPPARVAFLRFAASHKWSVAALAVALPFAIALAGSSGCSGEQDESEEAPLAASATPPPPASSVALDEDAGAPAPSASASSKPKAPAGDPTGLQACCHSLRNNAKTAPEDQKDALLRAADVCDSVVRTPETRRGLITVRGVLQGAKLPAECK